MLLHFLFVLAVFLAGFGLGRIKNAKKLFLISSELAALKADAKSVAKKVVTEVKSKL
jgi:hypothetical protein